MIISLPPSSDFENFQMGKYILSWSGLNSLLSLKAFSSSCNCDNQISLRHSLLLQFQLQQLNFLYTQPPTY